MDYAVKSGSPNKQRTACVVVGVFESRKLSSAAQQVDRALNGALSAILRRGDMDGKSGQTLLLPCPSDVACERVLLVGCGKEKKLDGRGFREVVGKTVTTLNETGAKEASVFLTDLEVRGRDNAWKIRQAVEAAETALYRFDQLKTEKELAVGSLELNLQEVQEELRLKALPFDQQMQVIEIEIKK